MTTKTIDFAYDLKATGDTGTFEGYGSVFSIEDRGGDIVAPGAFTETLAASKSSGRLPALLWQHRQTEPIGVYTSMDEDSVGLRVKGQLALKTARGAEAYELMKMGALSGLSIGYRVRDDSWDRVTGVRTIKKADLIELSLVTFPMNDASRVSSVKGQIETLEDLKSAEQYLRDAGLSRTEAKAFIARVKGLGQSDSDGGDMQQIVEALRRRGAALA
ncbi:HK97 family phage prohead protease [Aromatoleum toluolicum]|uniref:HK97 family phage prohead protease n=1 Tax=Aromatoleum toluolicum TaxID=90060 RepID=A0ABX1NGH2_9RHOO|nr:HK97 family phage prohead protease [Aromatoleum toluolicum]NMF98394.1 HK97 family phage prohead protease [Aromatoleum toluolicum]